MAVTPVIALWKVCGILAVPIDDVLEAFVMGSRLWQTANSKSDYDVYVVVRNTSPYVVNMDKSKGFANIHKANIDAVVMTEATYRG